ncbi:MAG: hypothetical protein V7L25_30985 [Nostoc sp.]|uniref:hypothetical protein n=1 Tax=Nostoc sp. TaxID=1180 RepID=UPI002FF38119
MSKKQISSSSKEVDTRILAIHALDNLIDYIQALDPELKLDEATKLAAITLHSLPKLIQENPLMVDKFREAAAQIKSKRHNTHANN